MNRFKSHKQNLQRILNMLEKGRFISRRQASVLFECTDQTITVWLNELREDGHEIHYSRSLQKFTLIKKK